MRAAREASRVSRAFVSVARGRPPGASSGFRNTHGHGNTSRLGVFDTKRSVHYTRCVPSVDDDVFRSSLLRPGTPSDKNNSTRRSPHNDALRSFHSGSPTSFKAKLPTGRSKRTQTEKEKEAGQGSGSDESTSSPNPNSSDESTSPEKEEKERDSYEFSDDRGLLGLHKKNSLDEANDARALNAVNVAVKANTLIFVTKLGAFGLTGSSVMLAEAVHSAADILNQSLLLLGIKSSAKAPDAQYNYGYRRERFVWSLISAVGVFFMGSGVSVAHGVHSLWNPSVLENAQIGIGVLALSAAIDAYSLNVAYVALSENAKSRNMTLTEFVNSGHDPTSVAVVAEDAAAVAGCGVAAAALLAAHYTGNNAYDALGSVAVGGLLGLTATYLINSNRLLLLGRSLGDEKMKRVVDAIRADPVVTEVYRAKSEELGPGSYRFVAEIEFSGAKVVERYLQGGDGAKRKQLHERFRLAVASQNNKDRDEWGSDNSGLNPGGMDAALRMYGEEVVAAVGDEVDRMEKNIVRVEPTIHYVDLETN